MINVKGKYTVEFSEGYASLQINEKWGYIDKTGKIAIEPKYDMAYSFTDGLALVSEGGREGFIDTDGNYVIKLTDKVDYASFSDGYALIRKGNKWGFIDKKGNIVIKPAFYGAADFKEGFASIMEKVGDKYLSGYINKKEK